MQTSIKQRLMTLGGILLAGVLLLVPNFAPDVFRGEKGGYNWISRPIALGLDLKGGVHLMFEVQTKEAVKSRLQSVIQSIRADLRKEKIAVTRSTVSDDNQLELVFLNDRNSSKAKEVIEENYRRSLLFTDQKVSEDGSGRVSLRYKVPDDEARRLEKDAVSQAVETVGKRVNQFGVAEPLVQRIGEDRILLQMPGEQNIDRVKRLVGKVAQLEFRLLPAPGGTEGKLRMKDRDGVAVEVEDTPLMAGDAVADARVARLQGKTEVSLTLTTEGTRTFRRITTENVGRQLAIILDGVVYSSPRINEPIPGGQASISGGFSFDEASELAGVLRAGALPASMKILEERTVGPSLGQQSIQSGILASLVGLVATTFFMIFYYRKSGAVAMISIFLNVFFLLGILSLFGVTLTLPGLAGLALTAGMAVDANIIIFERIRDELRLGVGRDAAVSAGYDKAFSAIWDSNMSTLIAGLILYCFGSGPVLGFALTLSVGVVTTVFCATWICKLFFDLWELSGNRNGLSI